MTVGSLGKLSTPERDERVPNLKLKAGQDKRTAAQYAADLARETDRSLRDTRVWPYTGPERFRARGTFEPGWSSTDARAGVRPTKGRWASSP